MPHSNCPCPFPASLSLALAAALAFATSIPAQVPSPIPHTPIATNLHALPDADLARAYCASCHVFPEPRWLDAASWTNGALPLMRPWLGLEPPSFESTRQGEIIALTNVYPNAPLLTTSVWNRIVSYYQREAPPSLPTPDAPWTSLHPLTQFDVRVLPYLRDRAMVSMVRIDPPQQRILVGDAMTRTLEALSLDGQIDFTVEFHSGPIDVRFRDNTLDVLLVGRLFPSDDTQGSLVQLRPRPEDMGMKTLLPQLRRPTHAAFADLDQDQREDLVICQFGHRLGRLSWFQAQADGGYREKILLDRPGAIKSFVHDFTEDGLPDILALTGQAWESVLLFVNRGEGQFESQVLVQQHPLFGYADLRLLDFNQDGRQDFLTVNGDNGEYLSPAKPYHGLRLYLNQEKGRFQEAWFLPLPGAYQAVARDFDLDGDIDVAAVSFFPDYARSPASGFVYFENQAGRSWRASSFEQSTIGRWLTLDAGDLDGDGDEDIVLGSLVMGPSTIPIPSAVSERWQGRTPPVLVLENRARQR